MNHRIVDHEEWERLRRDILRRLQHTGALTDQLPPSVDPDEDFHALPARGETS